MKKIGNVSIIAITIIILLIVAAFVWVDFRIAGGKTSVESQSATSSAGFDEAAVLPLEPNMDLYVIGPGRLSDAVQDQLEAALRDNSYIGEVHVLEGEPAQSEAAVLVLRTEDSEIFWTPIYSRSQVKVNLSYASDGEVTWMDEEVVNLTNSKPAIRYKGDFESRGYAFGIMSLPGYYHYLSAELSQKIVESLAASMMGNQ